MAAVVNSVCDRIETIVEALTPPDRTDRTYLRAERKAPPEGTSGNRQFYFEIESSGVEGERGASLTERMWRLRMIMRLAEGGRNLKTFQEAIANEANLVLRNIEVDTWSGVSGLVDVETQGVEFEYDDSGDAILTFEMNVHTQESD